MVENKQIISGIDIGTTKIAVVIAEWLQPENTINILVMSTEGLAIGMKCYTILKNPSF